MERKPGLAVESVTSDALELTQQMLDVLRKDMKGMEHATPRVKQELSGLLTKLMRAAATMIKEARALFKDNVDLFESMGYEDQVKVMIAVAKDLPPQFLAKFKKGLG